METSVNQTIPGRGVATRRAGHVLPEGKLLAGNGIRSLFYRLKSWETWDWRVKYLFIAPFWLWFCIRARSFWFFTASNPSLTFGGFDGERKSEMYAQLPPGSFPNSIRVSHQMSCKGLVSFLDSQKFEFPFVVKPDIGKMGLMFRRICSLDDLLSYHHKINCDYIIQELVSYPLEISVFYYRLPDSDKGHITGFLRKDFLEVTGDGRSTLAELIANYPRVQFKLREMRAKHKDNLHIVVPAGEKYCLSPALNLSRGGKLVSLEHEKDEQLLRVFDYLSHYAGPFYFGRYDIKCNSIEELRQGKHFSILEFNGSGAEPHHVYGNGNTLWEACSILVAHWKVLCDISRLNHRAGVPYWTFMQGWQFLMNTARHLRRLKQLDIETPHN